MARLYALGFGCLSLCFAACVGSGDETVLILNNQAPADGCVLSPTETGVGITAGVIDANSPEDYFFTPLVKNFSTANDDTDARRHIAFAQGAHVTITFDDPDLQPADDSLTKLDVPFSGRIDAQSSAQFGFPIVPHELVNDVGAGLTPDDPDILMRVDVTIYGTINNSSFETQAYQYPVEICASCRLHSVGLCSAFPPDTTFTNLGGACNAFQDEVLDCCENPDGTFACPAVGTMPPA
jgi:hypothetical protein